jgi:aspartate kinase
MSLVVLKFGGTSLANLKLMNNAINKVANEVEKGNRVIVVVSAMAGVTDSLISQAQEIFKSDTFEATAEYSSVITTGEQISAGLFALLLQNAGFKARSWSGWQCGIITDDVVNDADVIAVNAESLLSSFSQGYQVAVVTGFQGVTQSNRISSLGRGGSDTTAIILAGELSAVKCDIYTDVEGVFTADPRIVPKAQKLDYINYDEMVEFAVAGAKVLQAKSAILAKKYQVNLHVLSSFTTSVGTIINQQSASRKIAGIALDKANHSMAKVSIIGTNIDKENIVLQAIDVINYESLEISSNRISVLVKDEEKFDIMRYLHYACGLDQHFKKEYYG